MSDYDPSTTPATSGASDPAQRQWAMFAHLSAILGGLLTSHLIGGVGSVIGPFIIWQIKKDTMPFVADQAREALNFNITVGVVLLVLFLLGVGTLGIGFLVTGPLMAIVWIAALVFVVIAAVKAHEGIAYRYPLTWRPVK